MVSVVCTALFNACASGTIIDVDPRAVGIWSPWSLSIEVLSFLGVIPPHSFHSEHLPMRGTCTSLICCRVAAIEPL